MKKNLKKSIVRFAIALTAIVSFGFTACKKDANKNVKTVKIAYFTGDLCAAPVHYAIISGLFEEEFKAIGQKVEFVNVTAGGLSTGELVAANTIDAGFDLLATAIQPMENGLQILFTTGVHTGCTKYYVQHDSQINSAADLRGKKIGVPTLADSSVMTLKRKLLDYGIKVAGEDAEVEFIAYDPTSLGLALDKGYVDAIGIHDPLSVIAEEEFNFKKILDTTTDEKFKDEYCCQIFVTQRLVDTNPEGAAAYTRAIGKASAFTRANPREVASLQIQNVFVTGDVDFNTRLLSALNYTPSKAKGLQTFRNAATELKEFGILRADTDVEKLLAEHYKSFDDVPEGYTYNPETKEYIPF